MNLPTGVLTLSEKDGVFGAITDRTLAALRLILALSAFLILLIDPGEPGLNPGVTRYAVAAYILYSLGIYFFARRNPHFSWRLMLSITWADVLWYSAMITLGAGANAVFFFFYLFAIIAASSRGGTKLGLLVTAACTAAFLTLNIVMLERLGLDVARFARRTVYMAVLGFMLAHWGGAEATLRRKLTFLKELSLGANPRLGVDRTIRQLLRRLVHYYDADYGIFLIRHDDESEPDFYRVRSDEADVEVRPMKAPEQLAVPLMDSCDPTVSMFAARLSWFQKRPVYRIYDPKTQGTFEHPAEIAADVADLLNVRSFITAPLRYRERIRGRILIGSSKAALFDVDDALFLEQAADQILPHIENIRLVDRLASDAAEEERRKIARSVHDRVIQPYLGLQIGLKALQQELERSTPEPAGRGATLLGELVAMTRDGIDELRQYVAGLRSPREEEIRLVDSIRRYAGKFESATGIRVEVVDNACGLTMTDRLSAEVFQMAAEALSNIHRHTHARHAKVRLAIVDGSLELSVENDNNQEVQTAFNPASICERAEALGARTEILWPAGKTLVRVEVPL